MRSIKLLLIVTFILIGRTGFCQFERTNFCDRLNYNIGVGTGNYYGDLKENYHLFNQIGISALIGLSTKIIPRLNARVDFMGYKIHAEDSKNSRVDLKQRNLSFKSMVYSLDAIVEFEIFDLRKKRFTPYIFAGFGAFHFNPYTEDANGYKEYLQPLGTEGQGLTIYPDRKPYKRIQTSIPIGGGVKIKLRSNNVLAFEYKYRLTNTDYIDDVSRLGYPNKAALDARDTKTAALTWRGGEVGAGPYPTGNGLNRGNPKKNDALYSFQVKYVKSLRKR